MINLTTSMAQDVMADMFSDFDKCENIIGIMRDFQEKSFIPIFCMIAEEWAKSHGSDVCELIDMTAGLIHAVNDECGKY